MIILTINYLLHQLISSYRDKVVFRREIYGSSRYITNETYFQHHFINSNCHCGLSLKYVFAHLSVYLDCPYYARDSLHKIIHSPSSGPTYWHLFVSSGTKDHNQVTLFTCLRYSPCIFFPPEAKLMFAHPLISTLLLPASHKANKNRLERLPID